MQVACDEGLGDGCVDAHGDVASDSLLGPVPDGAQPPEVLERAEAGFDVGELPIGGHHAFGGGLLGGEAGGEHVTAREQLFVGVRVFVVVIDESPFAGVEVEQTPDAALADDALSGASDLRGIDKPPAADAFFESEQFGFGSGEELGGSLPTPERSGVSEFAYLG
ncbi:hypothetical protein [Candidatus Poriferisodalis sp.]|uniref:hypothetical protein n=1 Tax=Candidatus Poriferisodalis sp. TaxID=3101277 RepID=UPI003B01824F